MAVWVYLCVCLCVCGCIDVPVIPGARGQCVFGRPVASAPAILGSDLWVRRVNQTVGLVWTQLGTLGDRLLYCNLY